MKPLNKTAAFVALLASLILFASPSRQAHAQPASPAARAAARAAESFYRFHFARDRGFTRANVVQRRRFLSPELYRLLLNELRREAAFRKARPDEVPFMTGDPFTDSQENPEIFAVDVAEVSGNKASVQVTFSWRDVEQGHALEVELLRAGGRWLIHDVRRAGSAGLLKLLRRPVYESDNQ
jgi:hypothetical protein